MPTVKRHTDETPSEAIVKAGVRSQTVVDANGRSLTVKKIGALDRLRVLKAVGPVNSGNTPYLGYAMLAASVTEIDGDPVLPPVSEREIEHLVGRLGDDGLAAVAKAVGGFFLDNDAESIADQAKN